jgi:hypothetical protein
VSYKFKTSKTFWRRFYKLPEQQQNRAREKYLVFKNDPFHPSLGTHEIREMSAAAGRTIYSVVIQGKLRVVFFIRDDTVYSFDIGTHCCPV